MSMSGSLLEDEKKLFENVKFDEDNRYIIMHHFGAQKYYKLNTLFIALFLGLSYYNFKENEEVFYS